MCNGICVKNDLHSSIFYFMIGPREGLQGLKAYGYNILYAGNKLADPLHPSHEQTCSVWYGC